MGPLAEGSSSLRPSSTVKIKTNRQKICTCTIHQIILLKRNTEETGDHATTIQGCIKNDPKWL